MNKRILLFCVGIVFSASLSAQYIPPASSSGGSGDVVGPSSSVNGQLAIFSGANGKLLAAFTSSGILKATSGVVAAAVADTDYEAPHTTLSGYGITDGVPTSRTISTTSPLGGGGALSGNLTFTCTTCGTSANNLSFFSATTSAQLAALLSDETGSGAAVFGTSPTLVTPVLGTPASVTLTNGTGLPVSTGVSGLATGIATFLGTATSANLAAALTDETGTGLAVFNTSPSLVTPALGAATATTINKLTLTQPATGATLTINDGKTLTVTNNATESGTNTGDQTITATGDVTSGGCTGTCATTIAQGAVTDDKASLLNKPAGAVVATSNLALSGLSAVDGVTPIDGTVILASAQTTGSQNGPWFAHSGAWTRPSWYPSGGASQAGQFSTMLIRLGTESGHTWRMTTAAPITIDTTATTWVVTPYNLTASSVAGTLPSAQLPNPSASTLGGVKSLASASNKFLTQIGTDGAVSQAQPDVSNLSTAGSLAGNLDLGANADAVEIANAGTTGTTLNKWAKLTGAPSTVVIVGTSDTDGGVGLVVGGAGTTGNAIVARGGIASCVYDGATTANDYVQFSTTTAGDCHDVGSTRPTSGQILGRVLSTNGGAGTYAMTISGLGIAGVPAPGAACSTCTAGVIQEGNGANVLKDGGLTETAAGTFRTAAGVPLDLAPSVQTSDAATVNALLTGEMAYSNAATNTTGGTLVLSGGIGTRKFTVVTFGSTGGKTVTLTVNGTATTLTEGTDWTCVGTSNNTCASNLANAINANGTLGSKLTATATSANVGIDRKAGGNVYALTISTNAGAPLTATSGTDGSVSVVSTIALAANGGINIANGSLFFQNAGSTTYNLQASDFSPINSSPTLGGNRQWGRANTAGMAHAINATAKTANYTTVAGDYTVLVDTTGGAFTVTLSSTNAIAGQIYNIKCTKTSSNAVTLSPSSGQIEGGSTTAITPTTIRESAFVQFDGTNWWIIGGYSGAL